MRLNNRTAIPTAVIETLLTKAGRAVGARTGLVAVTVSPGQRGSSGTAWKCDFVRMTPRSKRWLRTDGGRIEISLAVGADPMASASAFFETARHEWGHIRDYQEPGFRAREHSTNPNLRSATGRRTKWAKRPEEIRAENFVWDADQKKRGQAWAYEEIMALAIALESYNNKRGHA